MLTTYVTNLIPKPCRRRYLTDAMVLSFNRMALQLTAHATH